jgi:adiponectin receptor
MASSTVTLEKTETSVRSGDTGVRSPNTAMRSPLLMKGRKVGDGDGEGEVVDNCCGRRRDLVSYDKLPEFLKHNEFIVDYYRSEWPVKEALLSAFSIHNETINVWT